MGKKYLGILTIVLPQEYHNPPNINNEEDNAVGRNLVTVHRE
jgi:hypothetical protein